MRPPQPGVDDEAQAESGRRHGPGREREAFGQGLEDERATEQRALALGIDARQAKSLPAPVAMPATIEVPRST